MSSVLPTPHIPSKEKIAKCHVSLACLVEKVFFLSCAFPFTKIHVLETSLSYCRSVIKCSSRYGEKLSSLYFLPVDFNVILFRLPLGSFLSTAPGGLPFQLILVPSISLGHNFRTIFHLDDFLLKDSPLVIIAILCI